MYSALVHIVLEENTHSQEDCSVLASSAGDDGRDCLYLHGMSREPTHNITACNTQHHSLLFSSAWMLAGKVFQPSRLCDFPWMDGFHSTFSLW